MPDLLLELLSEEIPARMQARAADDLKELVTEELKLTMFFDSAEAFFTPRRLALTINGLETESLDLEFQPEIELRGPRVDAPEKAIEGFLRGTGLTRDHLEERETSKGKVHYFAKIQRKPPRPVPDIVADVVQRVIRDFPWYKSMRWGTGSLRWVRPLRRILCILTDGAEAQIVHFKNFKIDEIASGNLTEGHRFMAPGAFPVSSFDDYRAKLAAAHVMLSAKDRAEKIRSETKKKLDSAQGLEMVEDRALLTEIAGLVEWPVVLMGDIAPAFLDLPPEVLQTSMRAHQKFLSVKNPATGRIEKFITVANRETADGGATILAGNQRVLAARLSDAKFFWENDLRVARAGMDDWIARLEEVTFHNRLGSQADRIDRIAALAGAIAPLVGADPDQAEAAARIAKADLSSEMVGEFPELQGVMGRCYAEAAGHPPEVAAVARDHYRPLGPSDDVPTAPLSVAVALADKIDLLAGFWAIDEKPTGSKDPFALRRAALGVIRIVLEQGSGLAIRTLLDKRKKSGIALKLRDNVDTKKIADDDNLLAFFHDRLKVHLRGEGISHDVIDAALSNPPADDLALVAARARALAAFLDTPDGENLIQGYRRAANILAQAEEKDGVDYRHDPDPECAETGVERALFAALDTAARAIGPALEAEDFAAAMGHMAALRAPIDSFFEAVQVNAENPVLRRNRLNLLRRIVETCGQVADLGKLVG